MSKQETKTKQKRVTCLLCSIFVVERLSLFMGRVSQTGSAVWCKYWGRRKFHTTLTQHSSEGQRSRCKASTMTGSRRIILSQIELFLFDVTEQAGNFLPCDMLDPTFIASSLPRKARTPRRFHGKSQLCPNFGPYHICPPPPPPPAKANGENDFFFLWETACTLCSSCHVTLSLSHNKLILRCGGSMKTSRDLPAGLTNRPQIIGAASDITRREECQIKAPRRSGRSRQKAGL